MDEAARNKIDTLFWRTSKWLSTISHQLSTLREDFRGAADSIACVDTVQRPRRKQKASAGILVPAPRLWTWATGDQHGFISSYWSRRLIRSRCQFSKWSRQRS